MFVLAAYQIAIVAILKAAAAIIKNFQQILETYTQKNITILLSIN